MKEKVTSYAISKRLHELGFDVDHETWRGNAFYWFGHEDIGYDCHLMQGLNPDKPASAGFYKAYDCHDLLMWLVKLDPEYAGLFAINQLEPENKLLFGHMTVDDTGDDFQEHPQNALGLAVIKILEEKEQK